MPSLASLFLRRVLTAASCGALPRCHRQRDPCASTLRLLPLLIEPRLTRGADDLRDCNALLESCTTEPLVKLGREGDRGHGHVLDGHFATPLHGHDGLTVE